MAGLSPLLKNTLLGFAGLALTAGFLLFVGANDTADWFSWTIQPPLTAAALGAFYWSAFALLLAGALAPSWRAARPVVYPVLVIATVLLVVTLIHLDRFDMDSLFGVFWLCAYIVAPPLLATGIVVERRRGDPGTRGRELPGFLRVGVAAQGVVLVGLAAVMLLSPESAAEFWPWTLSPLTSRALGAFVLGVGLVALLVARDEELILFRGTAAAYTALGAFQLLAVALHSSDLGDDGLATGIYIAFLTVIAISGLYGLSIAARASARS